MFKLFKLSIGLFAIVKNDSSNSEMPVVTHGFIQVSDHILKGYMAFTSPSKLSKELEESNELETLKEEAIKLTIEDIDDEYTY